MRSLFLCALLPFIFSSCRSEKAKDVNIEVITVKEFDENQKNEFYDYFDSQKLISLQTNKESIIGRVDRIIMGQNRIYILDRQSKSILVFNDSGGFEYKVHNIGKGLGEYLSLMDFTLDETKQQLIVHTDRPGKFIYYNLNGKFISEKKIKTFFLNLSSWKDNLILLPPSKMKNRVLIKNSITKEDKEYLPSSKTADLFRNIRMAKPQIVKSKFPYVTFAYCDTVFQFHNNSLKPKYRLDFGKKNLPEELLIDPTIKPTQILKLASENDYGFGISDFRENDSLITFSFGRNIVLYSKRTKKATTFRGLYNPRDFMHFYNYFAHDGDDNSIISLYQAKNFIRQMEFYEKDPTIWKNISEENKKIYRSLDSLSNPLLLICKLKN
ncbi:MAG: 6-bladed beta-propeller [Niabella sp.]